MVSITFRVPSGEVTTIKADVGRSVMQAATENDIPGIIGDCGGWCNCATCHVIVSEDWASRLPEKDETELAVLEGTTGSTSRSRLACQIEVTEEMDGLVLDVPASETY